MKLLIAALLLLVVPLASCRGGGGQGRAGGGSGATHQVSIRVHPEHAGVFLQQAGEDPEGVVAVLQQSGPVATFRLPEGSYDYTVRADGYAPYRGQLSIPQNRNLEVWLSMP